MLKSITILLSIYLLLLALLPCGDRLECNDSDSRSTSISETQHDEHQHETEICSPFCICACCGQLVNIPSTTSFLVKAILTKTQLQPSHREKFLTEPYYAIWQPPKLV